MTFFTAGNLFPSPSSNVGMQHFLSVPYFILVVFLETNLFALIRMISYYKSFNRKILYQNLCNIYAIMHRK